MSSTLTRGTTRLARRSATWTIRRAFTMTSVFIAGCIGGWWWDRPGLVRDKAIESVLERRAQVSSAIFWPAFAVWLAAGAPGCPQLVADLAAALGAGILPHIGWVIVVTLFAVVVLMRRLMAARGYPWRLNTLVGASRRWLRHHASLAVTLAVACGVMPAWAMLAHWTVTPLGAAVPTATLLAAGAFVAWREGAWRRRIEGLRPALAQAHHVPEDVIAKAIFMPRRHGLVMVVVPPAVVERVSELPERVARHLPQFEAQVHENPAGAVTSVSYSPAGTEELARRDILARTGDLVASLAPVPDPPTWRPDEHVASWGDRVTGTSAGQVNAALEALGFTVVEWCPDRREARVARLGERTVALRAGLVRELGLREPWDIEIGVETADGAVETVTVHRSPGLGGDRKRTDIWGSTIRAVMPPDDGRRWLVEDDAAAGTVIMRHIEDLLRTVRPYDWNAPVGFHHLPFGVREDGSPLTLGLLEVNALLGGTPGGGKSGGLTTLMCGIARLECTAMIGLDPKRVEQKPWLRRFSRIAKTEEEATDVLERVRDEMERRYIWLEEAGLKKFGPGDFTDERPLLVVIVDELADLVSIGNSAEEKKADTERATLIRRLIAKGRAAGIVVISATQKPQSDVVPTALRDLIQLRVAYATTNAAMTDTILGAGMAQEGGDAHTISAQERGVCFVVNEASRVPVRARTFWVPDEDVEEVAERYAHLRIDLPWLEPGAPEPKPFEPIPQEPEKPEEPEVRDLGEFEVSLSDLGEEVDEFEAPAKPKPHKDLSDLFD